jgi:hypothetical protein
MGTSHDSELLEFKKKLKLKNKGNLPNINIKK